MELVEKQKANRKAIRNLKIAKLGFVKSRLLQDMVGDISGYMGEYQ